MKSEEKNNLQEISKRSLYSVGIMPEAMLYCFKVMKRYLRNGPLLEMGPAEGVMTERLATLGLPLTVVEGSSLFCENLQRRFRQIRVVNALFEEFEPDALFDNIIMGHVLEHVEDPIALLKKAHSWMNDRGLIFCAVPNARSLHRQAAVIMGLLPREDALNALDLHHGHRRVFTPESLRNVFHEAGFRIEVFGGYFLKPLSNGQIEGSWTKEMVDAFLQMGERYPDIAGEIYVVATKC